MLAARVFFLAPVFNVRTSAVDHVRRFDFLGINNLQVRMKGLVADIKGEENRNFLRVFAATARRLKSNGPLCSAQISLVLPSGCRLKSLSHVLHRKL